MIGKVVAGQWYVHCSAFALLPSAQQQCIAQAQQLAGLSAAHQLPLHISYGPKHSRHIVLMLP